MIKASHIHKNYNAKAVLRDITFSIGKGEICSVLGPNGAGKSTLLKLLFFQEKIDRGQLVINDLNVVDVSRRSISAIRQRMGFISDGFRLIPRKTILENISLALTVAKVSEKQGWNNIDRVIDFLDLEYKKNDLVSSLSTGEQQRVRIARAVVSDPLILLADEPTENLDSKAASKVIELFKSLSMRGTTIILATQNQQVAEIFSQCHLVLQHGRVTHRKGV